MEFRLLRADEIDCKIKQVTAMGVLILLYKDARCDMNILDETVGPENWARKHKVINGNLFCSVGVYIPQMDMWVWKQDVGTESMTEKEKGEASDSFKRACFNWGIGRELYTAPFMWVAPSNLTTHKQDASGKWVCYDKFKVTDIQYTGKAIAYVQIQNIKKPEVIISFGTPAQAKKEEQKIAKSRIGTVKAVALLKELNDHNANIPKVMERYGVTALEDLTEEQHLVITNTLKAKEHGSNGKS